MARGSVLVLLKLDEAEHNFELPLRGTVADLRVILTSVCAFNFCLYLQDRGQLLCDVDVLADFSEPSSPSSLSPDPLRGFAKEFSPEEMVREFEHSPQKFYNVPEGLTVRISASEGSVIFVRTAGCVHSFHCGPQDTLGDLRDLCARTFSLDPVQVVLKDASGSLLPLSRDGHILQDIKNASILDAEVGEGSMRVFLVLSESCTSYVDVSAAASLSDFRRAVIASVEGLDLVRFRLWSRGAELNAGDEDTVGRQLFGGHPVYVEVDSELELLLLPKSAAGDVRELCKVPTALDMSASLDLWLEDETEERKALQGLFPQSRLEHLVDRVTALSEKDPPLSVNVDGRCLVRQELCATLQELHVESGAVIRTEPPIQLHVDFSDSDTMMVTVPCRCTTVLELRKKIEKENRMPLSQVQLVVNDFQLPDCLSISECGLRYGDHVLCRKPYRLRFWWDDQVASFFVSPDMNMTEVSNFLEEKTGISKDLFTLTDLSSGKVFLPSKTASWTVRETGLNDNSEIYVRKRAQGSGGAWVKKTTIRSDISAFPSFMASAASDDEDDDDDNFDSDDG